MFTKVKKLTLTLYKYYVVKFLQYRRSFHTHTRALIFLLIYLHAHCIMSRRCKIIT